MPAIRAKLNTGSVEAAIRELEAYKNKVEQLGDRIAKRLAELGYSVAYGIMAGHVFSGETLGSLEVVEEGPGRYVLRAESKALLFFEFGAGVTYGGGHPWDGELGMGPGTYPGQTHALDPKGWWFPTDDPRLIVSTDKNGQGWGHSYGNEPHMPFYQADVTMKETLLDIARDVLRND